MASGTPPASKRNSFQRLSSIFQLASPSFVRLSFDANATAERKRPNPPRPSGSSGGTTSQPSRDAGGRGYNPAPSILSTADSSLSSPLSPLLPATPTSPSLGDLPVPPTSNDLAAGEKAMLMRKMRKLSQVLGEVPVPRVADEEASTADIPERHRLSAVLEDDHRTSSPSPKKVTVSESAKKVFRRSFTLGTTANAGGEWHQHHVPRVKSLSSLRPSLTIPSPSRRSTDAPSSPITFAWPDGDGPSDTPNPSTPSSPYPNADESNSHSDFHKFLKRRDSTASSVLLADQNPEQVQRARAAKLSRHLGENVPPDVLRRAASPPPRATSPTPSARHVANALNQLSSPTSSLRVKTPGPHPRRPVSLDFRALRGSGTVSAPSTPSAHSDANSHGSVRGLRRTRSLWTKGATNENGDGDDADQDNACRTAGPLNEKQRVLNVKRARKMAQLFGDNPPSALFQITNFGGSSARNAAVDDAGFVTPSSIDDHGRHRDSLATIISISTTSLAPSLNGSSTRKMRDSYISIITTSSEMSAIVLTEQVEPEEEMKKSSERRRSLPAPEKPSSPQDEPDQTPLVSTSTGPHLKKTMRPSTADSSSSTHSERASPLRLLPLPSSAVIHQPARTPLTPPPFSDLTVIPWPSTSPTSPPPEDFQARRRRAAKLSRFFGVEVNQLAVVLPPEISGPTVPAKAVLAQEQAVIPEAIQRPTRRPSTTVAEAKNRRRFLGMNADDVKEMDMTEVIDQLRKMKNR